MESVFRFAGDTVNLCYYPRMTPTHTQDSLPTMVLIVLSACFFLVMAVSLMMGPLLVDLADEFDTSLAVAGQFASANFIGWAIIAPLVGPISDSYGRRPIALTGLGLITLGLMVSAVSVNYEMMFAFRIVTGLGSGMLPPNSGGVVADLVPPRNRGKYFGRLIGTGIFGAAFGAPAAAVLVQVGGWQGSFVAFGTLAAVVWILAWKWYPGTRSGSSDSISLIGRYKQVASKPTLWFLFSTNVAQRMVYFAMFSYLAAYLTEEYGLSTEETVLPLVLVGIGAIAGAFAGGIVAGRPSRLGTTMFCFLGGGIASVILFSAGLSEWLVIALALGVACFFSVGWPILTTRLTELAESSTATALGFWATSNQLGAIGGSAIGGLALALGGFSMVGVACLLAAIAAAAILGLKVPESPDFTR